MYKKIILMAFVIVQWSMANSQTISRKALPAAGGTFSDANNQLTYSIGEPVGGTLGNGSNILTQGFQQPGEELKLINLPSALCAGSTVSLSYNAIDIGGGNTFKIELSNAAGSFAIPKIIGTKTGNTSGNINVTVPVSTAPGLGYRIRIISSYPGLIAPVEGLPIAINSSSKASATPGVITGSTDACPYIGTENTITYTIRRVLNATGYLWTAPANAQIIGSPYDTIVHIKYHNGFISGPLQVQSRNACFNNVLSAARSLTITRKVPATPGTMITNTTNICLITGTNTPATYSIRKVVNALSYSWKVPAGASIIQSGSVVLPAPVNYPDSLVTVDTLVYVKYNSAPPAGSSIRVSAANNCFMSANRAFALKTALPATPGAMTSNPVLVSGNVCAVMNGTVTFTIAPVATATSYLWTVTGVTGGISITGANNGLSAIVAIAAGFSGGTVSVRSVTGCGNSAAARSLNLTVTKPATPASISGPASVCVYVGSATNATYTSAAVTGAVSYVWTLPAGATIVSGTGTRTISVHYNSFTAPDSIYVQASNGCALGNKRIMSLNGIGCARMASARSINAETAEVVNTTNALVYPNPTHADFTLNINTTNKAGYVEIELLNINGKNLKQQRSVLSKSGHTEIHVSTGSLISGTYLVRYHIGNEINNVKVVVVK